eukprot:CAMPEP_0181338048 /NCGR_PEP_ID=MMETSP1101-20121128/28411_1 /TAXON_ID=46948 /ORGANISM="Rhodomonas abbreviata, Strain Caron Lab Isolate" /LENGTH=313 /DNA_ID=CAMNT_0023448717 /DNA_START=8 /DNA_END=947 /DNA_ORIENTATION=+
MCCTITGIRNPTVHPPPGNCTCPSLDDMGTLGNEGSPLLVRHCGLVRILSVPAQAEQLRATQTCVVTIEQWRGADVGSGGYVWGAARRLAKHLREHGDGCSAVLSANNPGGASLGTTYPAVASRPWSKLTVLELGAGTGALGLVAAALGAHSVTLTDQAAFIYPTGPNGTAPKAVEGGRSLIDLMRRNVLAFVAADEQESYCKPVVREMVWGCGDAVHALPHVSYNLICASDVLLFASAHKDLTATLRALSEASTVVLIEHTDRDGKEVNNGGVYPKDLLEFLQELEADALWTPTIVKDHGRHLTLRLVRTLA